MGEKTFKTDLEIELEKALDERGIYFSCMNHDQLEKFWELDLKKLPEPPSDDEKEDDMFLPDEVRAFNETLGQKKHKNFKEWADEVGTQGVFLYLKKTMEELADELALTTGMHHYNFGIYKQRRAEINGFEIIYKAGTLNLDQVEEDYKKGTFMQTAKLYKDIGKDKQEEILDLDCRSDKITERNYGEKAKEIMGQKIYLFKKYKKRQKLDAKQFVKDLMKLIGA